MKIFHAIHRLKAAALSGLFFIFLCLSACGGNTVPTNNTTKTETPTPTPIGTNPETHEPPIVGRGGSFAFDFPSDKDLNPNPTNVGGKFKYVQSSGTQRAIQFVQILTQTNRTDPNTPGVLFQTVECLEADNCRLEVWLQPLKNGMQTDYEPIPAGAAPNMTYQGAPVEMLVDKRLKTKVNSHNPKSPHRWGYEGFGANRHFRVGKWRVVKANGTPVNFLGTTIPATAENDDSYTFYITTYHHP